MSTGPQSPMDRISAGFRPTRNKYTCQKCGHHIFTEDRDEGTTPFMIGCTKEGCGGTMESSCYRGRDIFDEPATFIWRKPTRKEYKRASPAMREHFDMGGLDMHPADARPARGS